MSGRRQHYLPQFVQKGFCAEDGTLWVHRKNTASFRTAPTAIGLEKDFYGRPSEGSLDDKITVLEKAQSGNLQELRALKTDTDIDHATIADLVTSLSIRSRWIRQEFVHKTETLFAGFRARIPQILKQLKPVLLQHPKVQAALQFAGASKNQSGTLVERLVNSPELKALLVRQIDYLSRQNPAAIQNAHLETMEKHLTPPLRLEVCRKLLWRVIVRPAGSFILADVGAVYRVDRIRFKALPDKGEEIQLIALPIAHTHLVVGFPTLPAPIDPNELNEAASKCSFEFFVARENSGRNSQYQRRIGEWSGVISEEQLTQIVEECIVTAITNSK